MAGINLANEEVEGDAERVIRRGHLVRGKYATASEGRAVASETWSRFEPPHALRAADAKAKPKR